MAASPKTARLIEVELHVRDLQRALHFYRELLGVPLGDSETHEGDRVPHAHATWGDWAAGGQFLMVSLIQAQGAPLKASVGFAVDDLARAHARLVSAGARVIRPPEHRPWGASASYEDDDGNSISLSERPRSGS